MTDIEPAIDRYPRPNAPLPERTPKLQLDNVAMLYTAAYALLAVASFLVDHSLHALFAAIGVGVSLAPLLAIFGLIAASRSRNPESRERRIRLASLTLVAALLVYALYPVFA